MMVRTIRWRARCIGLCWVAWWLAEIPCLAAQAAPPLAGPPLIYVAQVDALIHPVSAEYMVDTINAADASRAALVVFVLRTPGGLVDSTDVIVARMVSAKTPIAVYVGPAGSRAASAGFLITIAADVAAMAPGTYIGAVHPVSGSGEKMDETMSQKAASAVAASARSIASRRGRNVALVDEAVKESRAFTEEEALKASPPLIDLIATDVPDLLRKLDGRSITRFDGQVATLHTAGANVVAVEMTWRQRVLSALAHPNIAYLLLSLGMLGLTIELWNPGAVLPGIAGGICLLLAFFTFQVLPVNYAGLLLILFGILLFALEIKVASYGLLSAGGILSLTLGSMILMDASIPELRVSLPVIASVVAALAAILTFLVRLTVASQRRRSITGASGMIDEAGRALTPLEPGQQGRVSTHGEIWWAVSAEPIAEGEPVRVMAVNGLTLTVRRDVAGRPASEEPESTPVHRVSEEPL